MWGGLKHVVLGLGPLLEPGGLTIWGEKRKKEGHGKAWVSSGQ